MKATAKAPSNSAFIKYWGKKDEELRLPENGSISMNLSNLTTATTVEFDEKYREDSVEYNGIVEKATQSRAVKHLDRIRSLAKTELHAKVVTQNNFPSGTGLSSSASGFAALTVAGAKAAGLSLSEKELSILARLGSGSACRSIPDGFVEWLDGDTSEASHAVSLHPPDYWDIVDLIAIVDTHKKEVPTTAGQMLHTSSPFFSVRLAGIKEKIARCKQYLAEKNFTSLGELMEAEALEMHAIMLTSRPSLIYWTPGTLTLMKLVKKWRLEGLETYFTINTGQNVHILCERKSVDTLKNKLTSTSGVESIIVNAPSVGTRLVETHLF